MPAKSQAQRGYLNAKFGHGWVVEHGFDNKGRLPAHVRGKRRPSARHSAVTAMLMAAGHHPKVPVRFGGQ
jgi:hypothetical protein